MKVLNAIHKDLLQRFATDRLNDLESKQVRAILQRFVRGELDESESNEVIDVLAENERCRAYLDQLWLKEPAFTAPPLLEGTTSVRLQHKLFDRVHRANMMGSIFEFGIQGFFEVAVGLLRPFSHRSAKLKPRRKRNKR